MTKLATKLPKDDHWGAGEVIQEAAERIVRGEQAHPIVVVGVIRVTGVSIDPETGEHEATIAIRRLEPVVTAAQLGKAYQLLHTEWERRRGPGAVLPFEVAAEDAAAFGPVAEHAAQDAREAEEDADLSEPERLRRHLTHAHGFDAVLVDGWDDTVVRARHTDDHDSGFMDEATVPHDPDDWGWRRVDVADWFDVAEAADDGPDDDADDGPDDEDEA